MKFQCLPFKSLIWGHLLKSQKSHSIINCKLQNLNNNTSILLCIVESYAAVNLFVFKQEKRTAILKMLFTMGIFPVPGSHKHCIALSKIYKICKELYFFPDYWILFSKLPLDLKLNLFEITSISLRIEQLNWRTWIKN
ncbi:hypothetical protein T08_12295 [Trichinella sp. T8]|nr:hypothetical protein T08_12295 [Trichinella sp. T8]